MAEFTEDSSGEHELISTSLELEQLDAKLFRSKSLWTPARARGVFGGQVISQALLAATRCVEDGFSVHSLHCHFLLSADGSIPILYYVEHIRDGRTYCTRVVKAAQNGRWVFMITCSFQRPEFGQPSHQWPMPRHVPVPKDCPFQEDLFQKQSERPGIGEDAKQMLLQYVQERKRSPIAIKPAASVTTTDGLVQNMFWMRAKNVPKFEESFQKCILAYMSDLNFIGTAARSLQLRSGGEPPNRLGMLSSLDHTIWYYDHDFNCADWLLYVMVSPRTGLGRGVVHGRIYTQEGNLIAVLTQEGVVRADLGDNPKKKENPDTTMEEDEIIDVVATDPTPNAAPLTIDTSNFYAAPSPAQTPTTLLSGRPRRESAGIRRASLSYDPDAWEPNRSRAANRAAKAKIKNMQATGSTPKVKLKLTEKSLTANGGGMSFLGSYDRELDSDEEEDLVFEEQFILRMPPGEDCDRLRTMVQARDVKDDVWFKFKDSRRAVFHIGNNTYSAKLVDLPAIIESQKTLDNRQMYKVADICQMLVVEDKLAGDEPPKTTFNIDDYIWPHGLTPPMQHARKRRFRKRVNRNTIETVEKEVERLLDADSQASKIKYEILEDVDPNLSDSEFDPPPEQGGSEAATPGGTGMDTFDGDDGYQDGDGPGTAAQQEDDLFEQELQAELAKGLGEESDDEDGDDDEDQEESESEEEGDEEEDEEFVRTRKLLNEEIRDLEAAVAKKEQDIAGTQNILIKRRFEDALKKLKTDLDAKVAQRAGLLSAKDKAEAAAAEEEEEEEEEEEDEDDPDALDGDEQPVVLDVEGVATVLQPLGGVDSREMSTPRGDGDIEVATPMPSQPGTPAPDGMEIG